MRVAVISDIHANLHALHAVLAEIDAESPDAVWCLGDLVGYGPRPNECCELARERADVCLVGNHDLVALGGISIEDFNPEAAAAARWTIDALDDGSRAFLESLSPSADLERAQLFHASARDPVWEYVLTDEAALAMLRQHSLQQRPPAVNASDGRRRCDREPDGEFSGAVLRESRVDRRGIGLEGGCHPRHHRNRQVGAAQLELRRERPGYGLVNRNSRKTIGVILGLRDSRCQEAQGSEQREPSHQSRVSLGRHRAERVPRSPTLRGARANCVEITQGPEVPLAQNCAQARPETPEPEIVREPQSQRQIDPGRIRVYLPRVHRQY